MRILCREKMESLNKNLIILYNILFFIVVVLGFPFLIPIVLLSEKRRQTVLKRLGLTSLPDEFIQSRVRHPGKKLIWVHALSVGEVLSAAPLVKGLRNLFDTEDIIFSVSTKTGFEIASEHLRDSVDAIFFFPYDIKFSVKHITGKLNPSIVVIVETDIWPNFLFEMKKRNTPVIFVNARLSKSSFVGYKRLGFFTKPLFFCFANICTQSME
ncbi:MAG: 3-deoxy-D-manno-octulosonic acid transferase, partial [Desulfobacterales bacterium]|nr:3-deoxy-D-manno-octulosonic acid transferase [Desulfobacterales bacterium]